MLQVQFFDFLLLDFTYFTGKFVQLRISTQYTFKVFAKYRLSLEKPEINQTISAELFQVSVDSLYRVLFAFQSSHRTREFSALLR